MNNIKNNIVNTLCTLALEALVRIRSYVDGADGNAFATTCQTLATADHAYRNTQAQRVLKAVESNTSPLPRLILPFASLNLATRADLCEFNSRVVKAIRSFGCDFPLNRMLTAEMVAPIGEQLQEIEDTALAKIWPKICLAIPTLPPSVDLDPNKMSAQDIRNWMHANPSILMSIRELSLKQMQLSHLSKEIGLLVNLEKLSLYGNQLTSLPESVCRLTKLQTLNLENNQLTSLPESFGQLAQLQELLLGDNQLKTLPESFGQFAQLQTLLLNNNQLTKLPESFGQLAQLQTLLLNNNQLTKLPRNSWKIKVLVTAGNPLLKNSNGS